MYQKKPAKREKPDGTPYTVYASNRKNMTNWNDDHYLVVSIDPATDTYAFRIEKRYKTGKIEMMAFERVKFDRTMYEGNLTVMYLEITEFLNSYSRFYPHCHMFLIERQMVPNYRAIRVAQHTISYFMTWAANSDKIPLILEVNPQLKGKKLGVPKEYNRTYLKKWGVEKSKELLKMREDHKSITIMESYGSKQDDLADTVIMIEALFIHFGLGATVDMRPSELVLIPVASDEPIITVVSPNYKDSIIKYF